MLDNDRGSFKSTEGVETLQVQKKDAHQQDANARELICHAVVNWLIPAIAFYVIAFYYELSVNHKQRIPSPNFSAEYTHKCSIPLSNRIKTLDKRYEKQYVCKKMKISQIPSPFSSSHLSRVAIPR